MTDRITDQISSFYSQEAQAYSRFAVASFSWQFVEKPAFDIHIREFYRPDTKVLDVGSGSGRVIGHLVQQGVSPQNITGVDLSKEMLDEARKISPDVNLVQADIVEANFPENYFDLITSAMVFHYLDEIGIKRAMANFYKWLKNDGVLFYVTTHPIRIVNDRLDEYHQRGWSNEKTPWGTETMFFHRTTADFINETINAGFRIERVDEPDVDESGRESDWEAYSRYISFGASRLVIKARKV